MNQELREKVLFEVSNMDSDEQDRRKRFNQLCEEATDRILALFTSSLVNAQREAFVAGADWAVGEDYGDMGIGAAERAISEYATRMYPDADESDKENDFTDEDEQSALEGYPDA